jgi:uncharacterized protein YkwD
MRPGSPLSLLLALALCTGDGASAAAAADARIAAAAQSVRRAGCGNRPGTNAALRREPQLDRVAAAWARGGTLAQALGTAGVRAKRSASLRIAIEDPQPALRGGLCTALTTDDYAALGIHDSGTQAWVVVAQLFTAPPPAAREAIAARSLLLVNRARAGARRCGRTQYAPAPPLRASDVLSAAARMQAQDLAARSLLSHRGADGSDPGQRATRAGYRWRVVGENVASGPQTADEVIAGWLESPDHCENIMDPRYTEMGIAYAVDARSSGFIYWSQVFGRPR